MKSTKWLLILMVAGIVGACASTGGHVRGDPDELTREEILSVDVRNLWEVVHRLRPLWLNAQRRSGERSFGLETGIVVYQDQVYLGDVQTLAQWSPSAVYRLEWMDGARASASLPGLGSRHVAGAIIIHTRPDT